VTIVIVVIVTVAVFFAVRFVGNLWALGADALDHDSPQ